jgi:hypothetical protein
VTGINTRAELGIVFLKMVGKYVELLTDVSRDTGLIRANQINENADTVERYESDLRLAAEGVPGKELRNKELIEAFVRQTGVALQRRHIREKLRRIETQLNMPDLSYEPEIS